MADARIDARALRMDACPATVVTRRTGVAAAATAALPLLLAACAPPPGAADADGVPVTRVSVTDTACVPNEVTVKAGRNRFVVTNRSMRPLEWEILDGVMVVDERENIIPGLEQTLTTTLKPGRYVMTCGLLTNPRGTLVVEADADAPKAAPTPLEFIAGQAEYKVYVHQQAGAMQSEVAALAEALRAADLPRARAQYAQSRQAWQRLAPVALLASTHYDRLEGAATLYAGGESDPDFVGWHRIEDALFGDGDASPATLVELADALEADSRAFGEAIKATPIGADAIFRGASQTARRIAERKLEGLDNPYASADLSDAAANVAGLRRIVALFDKALAEHAPQQREDMLARLDVLQAGLPGDGLAEAAPGQSGLEDGGQARLADEAAALADDFGNTLDTLGL